MAHGQLEDLPLRWSADSRWLTWARGVKDDGQRRASSSTTRRTATTHQVDVGLLRRRSQPVFDPDGKYLYFLSNRTFDPVYSDFDNSWTVPELDPHRRHDAARRRAVAARARNDVEGGDKDDKKDDEKKDDEQEGRRQEGRRQEGRRARTQGRRRREEGRRTKDEKKDAAEAGRHRPRRASRRAWSCCRRRPATTTDLRGGVRQGAVSSRAAHRVGRREGRARLLRPRGARGEDGARRRRGFELDRRRQEAVRLSPTRSTASSTSRPTRRSRSRCGPASWRRTVDPKAEWRQMFADAFRFQRDFFYDPSLHGVDWKALARRATQALIDAVGHALGRQLRARRVHRRAERVAHLPRRRRRRERRRSAASGMLGVDWELAERRLSHQAHRQRRAPGMPTRARRCASPASNVKEGDYVLAVNGVPLRHRRRIRWAAFQGLADKTVVLTVNGKPAADGARQVHGEVPRRRHRSCASASGSSSAARASTRPPTGASATSTCRAPASTRRTS